jgi:hypothetical protein
MEKENYQEEEILETDEQTSQETDNEEVVKTEESNESERVDDSEDLKARLEDLEQKNKELYARIKRGTKKEINKTESQIDNLDLMEFFSQGGTKEDVKQVEAIMKGKDVSFEEAQKDSLYAAYLEKRQAEKKEEKAQLNTSRGVASNKEFNSEMSRDDHMDAYKKKMSKIKL